MRSHNPYVLRVSAALLDHIRPSWFLHLAVIFPFGALAFGQSYSPLYAPSTPTILDAYCYDLNGVVQPNCYVSLTAGYYPNTNAHTHNSPGAPLSTLQPSSGYTNSSGYLQVTLTPTIVGHAEYIQTCAYYCTNYQYAVGIAGIYWVSDHGIWNQVGAKAIHGGSVSYNHWMTSNAAYGIYDTTVAYQTMYPGLVDSNDMSLPFGGKFDLNGDWNSPHLAHDWGTAADIDDIPQANVDEFLRLCSLNHAVDARQESNGSLHCRWSY